MAAATASAFLWMDEPPAIAACTEGFPQVERLGNFYGLWSGALERRERV